MLALVGLIIIIIVCIIVKLFDKRIREYQLAKASINTAMFAGLLLFIVGLIQMITE